jgi:hypothetical protein
MRFIQRRLRLASSEERAEGDPVDVDSRREAGRNGNSTCRLEHTVVPKASTFRLAFNLVIQPPPGVHGSLCPATIVVS